ncbi:LysR family transcriptional regulator [Photobacterium sanctipauli]|uniref:LysR family transcriptional regulator n=1 Tax=Photobacterium sanctipauli TaxID=1342794 RepID=A0A2T3NUA2_9GAMM|nr:LysR family transcriptional regulator [Photobacterium sanctipauli]PSW19854.1 LysR family transcriptional regulator [Photobacterium sanctipauli]
MNWTIDQLDAFVTAVQQGSFSAAARKLGKAQSRISTAINNLELDLGFELFDRTARLPVLTPEGEDMYIEAQAVLAQCERLNARAMTVTSGEEVAITVAMEEALPVTAFEALFGRAAEAFPTLKLTILNGSQDDIAMWVATKQADLGILFNVKQIPDSLEFMSIGHFQHSLIVSRKHPLANVNAPTISQLNQYRQLVIRGRMDYGQAKAISANYWHIDSYYLITAMVARGIGWALVPEHVAKEEWYVNELLELSTEEIPEPLWVEIGVVRRRDRGCGKVIEWLYDELSEML